MSFEDGSGPYSLRSVDWHPGLWWIMLLTERNGPRTGQNQMADEHPRRPLRSVDTPGVVIWFSLVISSKRPWSTWKWGPPPTPLANAERGWVGKCTKWLARQLTCGVARQGTSACAALQQLTVPRKREAAIREPAHWLLQPCCSPAEDGPCSVLPQPSPAGSGVAAPGG